MLFRSVDDIQISGVLQQAQCVADLNGDRVVNGADLGTLLGTWGPCGSPCPGDLDGDQMVNGADLGVLLGAWGNCPN